MSAVGEYAGGYGFLLPNPVSVHPEYSWSRNDTRTAWVLKCDIRKFFANINHGVLMGIMDSYITDKDVVQLLTVIIGSFMWKVSVCLLGT